MLPMEPTPGCAMRLGLWGSPLLPASTRRTRRWGRGPRPPPRRPRAPGPGWGRGRPPRLTRRDAEPRPVSVKALALDLPAASWQMISWREGTAGPLASRFARVRGRAAHRDYWRGEAGGGGR